MDIVSKFITVRISKTIKRSYGSMKLPENTHKVESSLDYKQALLGRQPEH